jgi:hypothetical protein
MHPSQWIELLRKIPPVYQENLLLATAAGLEIAVQSILQYGAEHLLVRGRQGGTTDSGRVFCVPFDQINYVMFNREMKEAELREMFGELLSAAKEPAACEPAAETPSPTLLPAVDAPSAATPPPVEAPPPRPSLRDRLRSRLGLGTTTMGPRS